SFNTMIDQLSQQREALLSEIETNKKKSEALSQNNNLLEFITENISQWIVVIDRASSEWLYVNRDVSAVLRNMKNEQILRDWLCDQIMAISHGHAVRMLEFNLKCEGPTQYFSVAVHPLHWYEHDAAAFVFMDVSYEKRQLHELETAAYYDPLTNMFNRHYGMELLAKWLAEGISFVICFVDLDNLKFVNDKYGHAAGDTYILKVVEILQMFSFEAATCRLGGDEFMVLSHYCGLEEAENELEELRTLLKSNPDGGDIGGYYSISFGVVEALAGDTLTAGELLGIADEKMYKYKRAHKAQRDRKPSSPEQPDANRALLEGNGDSV
ncbi:MAG: diguanylate cyclase, partial [Synergistaceae bacterium]|nr:diguanylate cyclase [Synergistaceae bacterium]